MFYGFQVVLELVDEWDAGGDVEVDDLLFRYVVEIFHEGPQAIPVCRNQDLLPRRYIWSDRVVPIRQEAVDRVFQALRER